MFFACLQNDASDIAESLHKSDRHVAVTQRLTNERKFSEFQITSPHMQHRNHDVHHAVKQKAKCKNLIWFFTRRQTAIAASLSHVISASVSLVSRGWTLIELWSANRRASPRSREKSSPVAQHRLTHALITDFSLLVAIIIIAKHSKAHFKTRAADDHSYI